MKNLLLVFAHPDDESFAVGGTVAKYAQAGWQVDLVSATRGEEGSPGPHQGASQERLGEIRQGELERAAAILGISEIAFLGYRDGRLNQLTPGDLEDKIYQKLMQLSPRIVITFNPTGVSNHPDHIRICYSTTYAFQKYAADLLAEGMTQFVPKLYYTCMPQSVAAYLLKLKIIPQESFGAPWRGTPDKQISTVIDIRRFRSLKEKALLAHVSQGEDVSRFLSAPPNPLGDQEYFRLRQLGIKEFFLGKNDRISNRL